MLRPDFFYNRPLVSRNWFFTGYRKFTKHPLAWHVGLRKAVSELGLRSGSMGLDSRTEISITVHNSISTASTPSCDPATTHAVAAIARVVAGCRQVVGAGAGWQQSTHCHRETTTAMAPWRLGRRTSSLQHFGCPAQRQSHHGWLLLLSCGWHCTTDAGRGLQRTLAAAVLVEWVKIVCHNYQYINVQYNYKNFPITGFSLS